MKGRRGKKRQKRRRKKRKENRKGLKEQKSNRRIGGEFDRMYLGNIYVRVFEL